MEYCTFRHPDSYVTAWDRMVDGRWAADTFRLDQTWDMFSPVWLNDGWVGVLGTAHDGPDEVILNLLDFTQASERPFWGQDQLVPNDKAYFKWIIENKTIGLEKPPCVSCKWKTERWQKIFEHLTEDSVHDRQIPPLRLEPFLSYVCSKWQRVQVNMDA